MTKKQMERQARKHYKAWERSEDYALEFAYKSFSVNKARAWRYCQEKKAELNGNGLKIISHNTSIFTAGFEYYDEKAQTVKFYYITPSYDCAVDITVDMM